MKNKWLYWFGRNTSVFGDVLLTTALALHVMEITNSPEAFGGILALTYVPRFILSFFAGAIIDRFDSKKLMVIFDLMRFVILGVMVIIDIQSLGGVIFMVLSFATIETFFGPASISIVPSLFNKSDLSDINSIDQSIRSVLNVISPMIATFLYVSGGLHLILVMDGLTFLLSGISEVFLKVNEQEKKTVSNGIFFDMKDAVKVILKDKRVTSLLVNGALTHLFLFTFIEIGMISLLTITFKSPKMHYGILQGVISGSAIFASFLAVRYRKRMKVSRHINIGIIGMIMSVILFVPIGIPSFISVIKDLKYIPLIYLSISCFFMFVSFGYYVVFFRTFYQSEVPKEYLGRFSSIFLLLVSLARVIGMYIYGVLFENNMLLWAVIMLGAGMLIKLIVHIPFIKAEKREELSIEKVI